jgi:hypothetical protein
VRYFESQRVDHLEIRMSSLLDGSLYRRNASVVRQVSEGQGHLLPRPRELQHAIEVFLRDDRCACQQHGHEYS